MIYWFTGQPGSGKTTLAKHLYNYFSVDSRQKVIQIDGDDLRDIFQNKDYSEAGRRKNIENAQNIAKFLDSKGFLVLVSLVSPYKDQRDEFKKTNNLIEIFVTTSADRGRNDYHVTNYEPPTENYIKIDTTYKKEPDSFIELVTKLDL